MLLGLGSDERPVEKISGPVQDSFIQNCRPRVPDTLRCVKPPPLLECILFRNLVLGDELYRCRVLLKYVVGSHEPPILMLFWPYRYPAHLPRAAKNPLSRKAGYLHDWKRDCLSRSRVRWHRSAERGRVLPDPSPIRRAIQVHGIAQPCSTITRH